ncbi:MAG: hypothetical protein WC149_00100 [Arcobacteraceae bacterium]
MQKYSLEFCFKGSRNYVQGPDIFDAVIDKLKTQFNMEELSEIKYSAHEMLHTNANMIIMKDFNKDYFERINSVITFRKENIKYYIVVSETEDKIGCSTDYSEETVRLKSILNGNIITFENELEDSITEIIVSMNKYFLQETVTKNGKWIVTKFEYKEVINMENIKHKELKLELTNNFNNKLTKSTIFVNSCPVGYLYFSLI